VFQGLKYVFSFSLVVGAAPLAVILDSVASGILRRPEIRLLFVQVTVWSLYIVWVGGDAGPSFRYLIPVIAPVALLTQEASASLLDNLRLTRSGIAGLAVAALFVLVSFPATWSAANVSGVRRLVDINEERASLGLWLKANAESNDTLAFNAAGILPFYAQLPGIDMLGLTDRHIARYGSVGDRAPVGHKKHDAAYVLQRRPSFIIMNLLEERGQSLSAGRVVAAPIPSNEALLDSPELWANYTRIRIPALASHEVVFARNDRAQALTTSGLATPVGPD
jgi:hypothetical protein